MKCAAVRVPHGGSRLGSQTRQPACFSAVTLAVPRSSRVFFMITIIFATALLVLALVTWGGVIALQRIYPAQGVMIDVTGATLNVVDIGPRGGQPVVLIHGASSNLEAMRKPLGDRLAEKHRVILIDRPGHGWSSRARDEGSTPQVQGRMIEEALAKLDVG